MHLTVTKAGKALECDFREGCAFLIDKPQGWTSFDVVNKLRGAVGRLLGVRKYKVGHAGTLDPLATGLLILCLGKWTKKIAELQDLPKSYEGVMRLGGVTPSYDAETEVTETGSTQGINLEMLRQHAGRFTGAILQTPPIYSAIKVDGTPLYRLARKGKEADIPQRKVIIDRFEIMEYAEPEATFAVDCSKGTYIRSLVHDLGQSLGCGAYLTALRRTSVGPYRLEDAWQLDELVEAIGRAGSEISDKRAE